MKEESYDSVRGLIEDGDLCLFPGKALWPSLPIRFWDNGHPWHSWRGWCTIGSWSHAEFAVWDRSFDDYVLESWGSVKGGPRKIALSTLVNRYGYFGWRRFRGSAGDRELLIARAKQLWRPGPHYPGLRQYLRTAFRGLFGEKVDIDPTGMHCCEWVGACHRFRNAASLWPSDLAGSHLFDEVVIVKAR